MGTGNITARLFSLPPSSFQEFPDIILFPSCCSFSPLLYKAASSSALSLCGSVLPHSLTPCCCNYTLPFPFEVEMY